MVFMYDVGCMMEDVRCMISFAKIQKKIDIYEFVG